MEIYVVRHAIAEERREGEPDTDRPLTAKGVERFERHVRALRRLDVRFSDVLHSPWRRAEETAALLAPLADRAPMALDALAGPPDDRLLAALTRCDGTAALVGHEPWLSELVSWLVVGERDDGDARFALKKGAIAHLEGAPRPAMMQLRGLYSPALLRLAAG